jgi:hypothetical protein
MSLATLTDYVTRFGSPADEDRIAVLLNDASSLVKQEANQNFERVDNDTVSLEGGGDDIVFLPELPVLAVDSVTVSGELLTAEQYDWWEYGMLRRNNGVFPNDPRTVVVVYDHGYDPVPPWLTQLVCTMAQRAVTQGAQGAVRSESFVDAYSVSYASTGGLLGLNVNEVDLIKGKGIARTIV